jgi:hypothetical protein
MSVSRLKKSTAVVGLPCVKCEIAFAVWAGAEQKLLYRDQRKGNWREKEKSVEAGRAAM